MNNQYYAVVRYGQNTDDDLQHWKYIKRIKDRNGRYHYIYDRRELDRFAREATVKTRNKTGGTDTVKYKKNNGLFREGTETFKVSSSIWYPGAKARSSSTTTVYQGKLDRVYAKAEKLVYDTFYKNKKPSSKKSLKSLSKQIDSGKKKLDKVLNSAGKGFKGFANSRKKRKG